jgi:hypothetical protein
VLFFDYNFYLSTDLGNGFEDIDSILDFFFCKKKKSKIESISSKPFPKSI